MNQNSSQAKIRPRPKSSFGRNSTTPNKPPASTTPTRSKNQSLIPKSTQKTNRPHSVNQSYDFSLDCSNMFHNPSKTKSKFFSSAVPSPKFDVQICKEEIFRLQSQLSHNELLQSRMMRSEWRAAQRSMDIKCLKDQKSDLEYKKKQEQEFRIVKEEKTKEAKLKERMWKEEEFRAHKEAKLIQEREERKRKYDDLLREKNRFLNNQENNENKKVKAKEEKLDKRNDFIEFVQAEKIIEDDEKVRELRERKFEYAQSLGAKWLRLKYKDDELKENLEILNKLMY